MDILSLRSIDNLKETLVRSEDAEVLRDCDFLNFGASDRQGWNNIQITEDKAAVLRLVAWLSVASLLAVERALR